MIEQVEEQRRQVQRARDEHLAEVERLSRPIPMSEPHTYPGTSLDRRLEGLPGRNPDIIRADARGRHLGKATLPHLTGITSPEAA
jgi:hypothetical protein